MTWQTVMAQPQQYTEPFKKTQTNPTDIELASKRLKEWKNGQGN